MTNRLPVLMTLATAGCVVDADPLAGGDDLGAEIGTLQDRADAIAAAANEPCPRLVLSVAGAGLPAAMRTYTRVASSSGVTCRDADTGDVVVKVGDFWIDKYEVSECGPGELGRETGNDTTVAACSRPDVAPQVSITWFQTAAMCANAGKHLCTNAEWQAAVSGTVDPGASRVGGACLTDGLAVRSTGNGSQCSSRFGAEDMIGNVREWVGEWHEAGLSWQSHGGEEPTPQAGVTTAPWREVYNGDATWDVNGTAGDFHWEGGLPAAPLRGGDASDRERAGVLAWSLELSPSNVSPLAGARCCIGGR